MIGTHNSQNSSRNKLSYDQNHFIGVLAKNLHLFHHPVKTIRINTKPIITYLSPSKGWTGCHHKKPQLPKLTSPDPFIYTKVNGTSLDATTHLIISLSRHRPQSTIQPPIPHIQDHTDLMQSQPNSNSHNLPSYPYTPYRESPLPYKRGHGFLNDKLPVKRFRLEKYPFLSTSYTTVYVFYSIHIFYCCVPLTLNTNYQINS